MFQPVDEILTVLEFTLCDPCRHVFERLVFLGGKIPDNETTVGKAFDQYIPHQPRSRIRSIGKLGVVIMSNQATNGNPGKVV